MELLVPTWSDLAGWAGALFAALVLLGFGRVLSAGRATPEAAVVAGWGGAAFLLTVWGVLTPASLRLPAAAIAVAGGLGLVMPRLRPDRMAWRGVLRIVAVALPLLALMASARPSLPDTWLNLLPNAAYLYDYGRFPADAGPPAHSFIAGAPYNMQLAAFIASLVTPGFPASAMIGLNLVLQLAAALLLARLAQGSEEDARVVPSWGAASLGLLLATAFNPGFVPRYHLSAYSEASVTVTVAFAGWLAARALGRLATGRPGGADLWLLALTLAALVNIKQESVSLVVGIVASAGGLALLEQRRATAARAVAGLVAAGLPAALLYGAWRWYVLTHFTVGELKPLPMAEWQVGAIPIILWNILGTMGQKPFFFGVLAAVLVALVRRLRRSGGDGTTRPGALLAGVFVVYNAALLFAYVAHFPGEMGREAHSYFRYNTHLALLLMVALVPLARGLAAERGWTLSPGWRQVASPALLVIVLATPVVFLRYLRFDLEVPQLRAWDLAKDVAARISDHDRLVLLLPGDNQSLSTVLEGVLRFTPPRRRDIEMRAISSVGADALDGAAAAGFRLALLSCTGTGSSSVTGVPPDSAALLRRDPGGWRVVAVWPYLPPPPGARWSQVIAPAPLCL